MPAKGHSQSFYPYIREIFRSIQGEGLLAGLPMTFIRFQYCPYDCSWCDTKDSLEKGEESQKVGLDELVRQCLGTEWVCITGGEPLAQPEALRRLVQMLVGSQPIRNPSHRVTIETSGLSPLPSRRGVNPVDGFRLLDAVDSWVVDVKLGSSGVSRGIPRYEDLCHLRSCDQVKFVVTSEADFKEVDRIVRMYPTKAHVLISPVFPTVGFNTGWLQLVAKYCIRSGYRLSLQQHKLIGVR